ncbi:hypothetical protein [Hymenobacter negativus]|uniref:hypothetical protein n=1 Tax=Hymenobacter negativus TaxID=2795026 RepID=UPI0018DE59A0|nr:MULTISPECIES: hypothetical protein [Bacteria]MBH8568553.1 hypothetical protein [Hymenobacter negativus]MBR7208287.1 hypothetical protein [Microvirga sp. STS02]
MTPFLLLGSLAPIFNTVGFVALVMGGLLLFAAYKLLKESNAATKFMGVILLAMGVILSLFACLLFVSG